MMATAPQIKKLRSGLPCVEGLGVIGGLLLNAFEQCLAHDPPAWPANAPACHSFETALIRLATRATPHPASVAHLHASLTRLQPIAPATGISMQAQSPSAH
jgi:hypothetical protein